MFDDASFRAEWSDLVRPFLIIALSFLLSFFCPDVFHPFLPGCSKDFVPRSGLALLNVSDIVSGCGLSARVPRSAVLSLLPTCLRGGSSALIMLLFDTKPARRRLLHLAFYAPCSGLSTPFDVPSLISFPPPRRGKILRLVFQ